MGSSCEWCLFLDESIWEVYLIINIISIISISFIRFLYFYWALTIYQELFLALGIQQWTEQTQSFFCSTGETDDKQISTYPHASIEEKVDRVMTEIFLRGWWKNLPMVGTLKSRSKRSSRRSDCKHLKKNFNVERKVDTNVLRQEGYNKVQKDVSKL